MYEIIVGNIGSVYRGADIKKARRTFNEYKRQSKSGFGRAGHETVTFLENDEPVKEFVCKCKDCQTLDERMYTL